MREQERMALARGLLRFDPHQRPGTGAAAVVHADGRRVFLDVDHQRSTEVLLGLDEAEVRGRVVAAQIDRADRQVPGVEPQRAGPAEVLDCQRRDPRENAGVEVDLEIQAQVAHDGLVGAAERVRVALHGACRTTDGDRGEQNEGNERGRASQIGTSGPGT